MNKLNTCISVFGLGYVGCVTAACLASRGYKIIGVDVNLDKVEMIKRGESPIIENMLGEYIKKAVENEKMKTTTSHEDAIIESDCAIISVGTPSCDNGDIDLKYVKKVSEEIGAALRKKNNHLVLIYRSTLFPGTMEKEIIPILERESGKKTGIGFDICFNPEFLREGNAIEDFLNPPKTVIGVQDKKTGKVVSGIYKNFKAPLIITDIKTAEMVKYVDNIFHALKVTFANEIGLLCRLLDIESYKVMDYFCQDRKLNLSPCYLKPGFAFGGSCLSKDLRAFLFKAGQLNLQLPMLNSIITSNVTQIRLLAQRIVEFEKKKIGILGLSFKTGTDDFRNSPLVELTEFLLDKGYNIKIYDKDICFSSLFGANREFILERIPQLSELMVNSSEEIIEHAEVIVIGKETEDFVALFDKLHETQVVLDLVHISGDIKTKAYYEGIYWTS